jgi:hypothetical protein
VRESALCNNRTIPFYQRSIEQGLSRNDLQNKAVDDCGHLPQLGLEYNAQNMKQKIVDPDHQRLVMHRREAALHRLLKYINQIEEVVRTRWSVLIIVLVA